MRRGDCAVHAQGRHPPLMRFAWRAAGQRGGEAQVYAGAPPRGPTSGKARAHSTAALGCEARAVRVVVVIVVQRLGRLWVDFKLGRRRIKHQLDCIIAFAIVAFTIIIIAAIIAVIIVAVTIVAVIIVALALSALSLFGVRHLRVISITLRVVGQRVVRLGITCSASAAGQAGAQTTAQPELQFVVECRRGLVALGALMVLHSKLCSAVPVASAVASCSKAARQAGA